MNCRICGAQLPPGAMFCGECGSSTSATRGSRRRPDARPSDTTVIPPLTSLPTASSIPVHGADDLVAASAAPAGPERPMVPDAAEDSGAPPRFVLQFSTGETLAVHGTGLIGRRPLPQPAERFDHLIQIADMGMSVSKSHLEFGIDDGRLWISDRFSGNGTLIRRPDGTSLRCEPGRRCLVPRGSRVEIGDQFFVVS